MIGSADPGKFKAGSGSWSSFLGAFEEQTDRFRALEEELFLGSELFGICFFAKKVEKDKAGMGQPSQSLAVFLLAS